jgi:isopentenyl-diphosphate delta-isomerase
MEERIILVNEADQEIGTQEKLLAHQQGSLHRAFSIFIFNSKQEMLIHQRTSSKYHSGGLWTNACCSHQRPGENTETAAHRRLQEEMGFDCPLQKAFTFIYKVEIEKDNLFEHELDHVFIGHWDGVPHPNPTEVKNFKWVPIKTLTADVSAHPEKYTYWFKQALDKVIRTLLS